MHLAERSKQGKTCQICMVMTTATTTTTPSKEITPTPRREITPASPQPYTALHLGGVYGSLVQAPESGSEREDA